MLTEEELGIIKKGIKKHIEMELRMIKLTENMARETDDPRLKMVLMAIHDDEVKTSQLTNRSIKEYC